MNFTAAKSGVLRTKIFCVCRIPNRPSKLAYANFPVYLLNLPPRPD
jgi:hypothetical protein